MKCSICDNQAFYRSNITVKKSYTSFYCEECAKGGLGFGWLEEDELVKLE